MILPLEKSIIEASGSALPIKSVPVTVMAFMSAFVLTPSVVSKKEEVTVNSDHFKGLV